MQDPERRWDLGALAEYFRPPIVAVKR